MDVSKNRGILPPKWMVKIMEKPINMDDLGVPLFLETPIYTLYYIHSICIYHSLFIFMKGSLVPLLQRFGMIEYTYLDLHRYIICIYHIYIHVYHHGVLLNSRWLSGLFNHQQ